MQILSPRAHGYVDYLVVIGFFAGPRVFEFDGVPATIAYVLAGAHLVLTLATAFPLGLVRIVPFPLHGIIEFFSASRSSACHGPRASPATRWRSSSSSARARP
jgi:hypothetical protein